VEDAFDEYVGRRVTALVTLSVDIVGLAKCMGKSIPANVEIEQVPKTDP
jgi:hypothetical protein